VARWLDDDALGRRVILTLCVSFYHVQVSTGCACATRAYGIVVCIVLAACVLTCVSSPARLASFLDDRRLSVLFRWYHNVEWVFKSERRNKHVEETIRECFKQG
jgi:hypothetical protein